MDDADQITTNRNRILRKIKRNIIGISYQDNANINFTTLKVRTNGCAPCVDLILGQAFFSALTTRRPVSAQKAPLVPMALFVEVGQLVQWVWL